MRKLALGLVLAAVALGGWPAWAGPVIRDVQIERRSDRRSASVVFYGETVSVTVYDADGASAVASVSIILPEGTTYTTTPSDTDTWTQVDANTITASYLPCGGDPSGFDAPAAGVFTVTATDQGGGTDALTATTAGPIPVYENLSPADKTIFTTTTSPTFGWSLGKTPKTQSLTLWESGDELTGSRSPLWTLANATGTSAVFNADGTAVHKRAADRVSVPVGDGGGSDRG